MTELTRPPKIYYIKFEGFYKLILPPELRVCEDLAFEFAASRTGLSPASGSVYHKSGLRRVNGTTVRVSSIAGIQCIGASDLIHVVDRLYESGWRVKNDMPHRARIELADRLPRILYQEALT